MAAQVLVVGAGPVGLTMAAELARYGVAVRIVEKAAARTDKSKALVLWSRTLELLDRAGCSAAFVAAGHKVDGANIVAGTKHIAHASFAQVESPYRYALMLPQSDTERLLEEHLNRLGVQVERQVELMSFSQAGGRVSTTLRHVDGREESLDVEWLIGCDGAHSTVRHALGKEFLGNTLQSSWILADVHLHGFPFPESEIATYWHEDGVLVFFPISPGRFRVIANVEAPAGVKPADPTLAEVQAVMDRRGPGNVVMSDPIWLAAFKINERKVADYRDGRVFLAGDAAHVHSPAGGQGMNTGMQDAISLAWKLALVCRGEAADGPLLASYSIERSAIGEQVLAAAGRMTAVAILQNHALQAIRNFVGRMMLGLAPVQRKLVNQMTEVSIGYDDSPLNGPAARGVGGPQPGERVAPRDGETPFGFGNAPRFALCAGEDEAVRRLLAEFPKLLDPKLRAPRDPAGMLLVRPDGYAAVSAKIGDERPLVEYLRNVTAIATNSR
jgi:2-polyprenyl-6-methoxyphenol hydroxylase-like FAD-dependent oxidoreductase